MKQKINSKLRNIAETHRNVNKVHKWESKQQNRTETQHKQIRKRKIRSKLRNITETYSNINVFDKKAAAEWGVADGTSNGINCRPLICILDFGWWMFKGKHANGRNMLEIARTHFELIGQVSYLTTKMGPWHVLMASCSCFPIVFQREKKNRNLGPQFTGLSRCGRSFHAMRGPFHGFSRGFTRILRPSQLWCWEQGEWNT